MYQDLTVLVYPSLPFLPQNPMLSCQAPCPVHISGHISCYFMSYHVMSFHFILFHYFVSFHFVFSFPVLILNLLFQQ